MTLRPSGLHEVSFLITEPPARDQPRIIRLVTAT